MDADRQQQRERGRSKRTHPRVWYSCAYFLRAVFLGKKKDMWWATVVLWAATQACMCRLVPRGGDLVHTQPRWRVIGFLWSQCFVLPCLYVTRQYVAFAIGFPVWMLLDLACLPLSATLVGHHLLCLLGPTIALLHYPSFALYALAVCALELGSAAVQLRWVGVVSHRASACCMIASNLAALVCLVRYVPSVGWRDGTLCVLLSYVLLRGRSSEV